MHGPSPLGESAAMHTPPLVAAAWRRARAHAKGRLEARPRPPGAAPAAATSGARSLPGGALLFIPAGAPRPATLLVLLHGADGRAATMLEGVRERAERAGVVVLAPQAPVRTWDLFEGGLGRDVGALDDLLDATFACVAIAPARVAVAGFSDGGSYALTLGIVNGELFTDVLAFSPGSWRSSSSARMPAVFIVHGTQDAVLPIDRSSRRIVKDLRERGFDVAYREHEGGHLVTNAALDEAFARLRTPAATT